jgi:hypothetical protein
MEISLSQVMTILGESTVLINEDRTLSLLVSINILGNYLNREFVIDTAGRPYTGEHRYK